MLLKWTTGIAILFLFPYVMKYSFDINDSIVKEIRKTFTNNNPYDEIVGSYIGGVSNIQYDYVFELRSPEYVSRSEYLYSVGTPEATMKLFNELQKYQQRGDLMRIIRALAGISGKFIYVVLCFIMLWQLLILLFVYLKRYLMIAFLIIIFPVVVVEYIISSVTSGKGRGFSAWCMEFFLNVFLQTIHAVIYGIIGGVITAHVQNQLVNGKVAQMNWILLIVSISFIFEGEAILKQIIKANAASVKNSSEASEKAWGAVGGTYRTVQKLRGK